MMRIFVATSLLSTTFLVLSATLIVLLPVALAREPPASFSIVQSKEFRDTSDDDSLQRWLPEAHANGPLVLADGDVLRGRIVADGIDLPEGATMFFEDGTELVSTSRTRLLGTLVPKAPSNNDDNASNNNSDQKLQVDVKGKDGADGPNLRMLLFADAIVPFDGFCNPQNIDGEDVQGTGSVEGGRGGHGGDVTVLVQGGGKTTLTIKGPFCNQPGGKGGTASAVGAPAKPCEAGNPATAKAGDGGNSGSVRTIVAPNIDFGKNPLAHFNLGGSGGAAYATASDGVFCPTGCLKGGDGGAAVADGGDTGFSGDIDITTGKVRRGLNQGLLAGLSTNMPEGGFASAQSGTGAAGGNKCACGQPGGDGGYGGGADAYGGDGHYSAVLFTRIGNNQGTEDGFNGPMGGAANAIGGVGGEGAQGGDCPCEEAVTAGKGGDGGEVLIATAIGGDGGDAYYPPGTGGTGGFASAKCGNGGDGGKGGSCFSDLFVLEPLCTEGKGGSGGVLGYVSASGGRGGIGRKGAADENGGLDSEQDCKNGQPGPPGDWKCFLD